MKSKERARDIMSINIQERVLDTLFDIAVEEIGVCDDMTRAYDEWYQFCTDNRRIFKLIDKNAERIIYSWCKDGSCIG